MSKRNLKLVAFVAMMFVALGAWSLLSLAQSGDQAKDGNTLAVQSVSAKSITQQSGNQRFYDVKRKLDEGGDFYLYWSVKGILRNIVTDFKGLTADSPNVPQQLPMIVTVVDRALENLGIYNIEDIGVSVKRDQGMAISKTFIRIPGEKKGVFDLLGGSPHSFDSLNYAPADTGLFATFDLDLAEALSLIRTCLKDIGGEVRAAGLDSGLDMAGAQLGTDIEALIDSLSGEYLIIANFHPTEKIRPPEPELAGLEIAAPQGAFGIRVKNPMLYDQLTTMVFQSGVQFEDLSTEQVQRMAILVPPNDVYQVDPQITYDGQFVFIASHGSYLDKIMAAKAGGRNLSDQDEFKTMMRGLPARGNELGYFSTNAADELKKIFQNLQELPEFKRELPGQARLMFNNAMAAAGPSVSVRVNDRDGLYMIHKCPEVKPGANFMALMAPLLAGIETASHTATAVDK